MNSFLVAGLFFAAGFILPPAYAQVSEPDRKEFLERLAQAELGEAEAQKQVGSHYANGKGVKLDLMEAARWYRKAAEQNLAQAQVLLGACYLSGQGVPSDYVEAYAWWSLAATKDEAFLKARADLEKRMSTIQVAEAEKRTKELQKMIDAKPKVKTEPAPK